MTTPASGFRLRAVAALGALLLGLSAGTAFAFNEAPMLAEQVKAGKLPAVDKRLPEKPQVVTPNAEVGTYGGVIRRGLRGSSDHNGILRYLGAQGLTRWTPDFSGIVPNLAESWQINAEATEFTFKIRAGTKWSDGQPFTIDDIIFFVDDLLANRDFYKAPPPAYAIDGKAMTAEKIDDNTVKLKFSGPYGQFLQELATPLGQEPVLWAKHYCKQFHPKYNPNIADLVKKEGANDWAGLFRAKCGDLEIPARWGNPDRPTLDAWIVTKEAYTGGATRVVFERNPYFWQVDTAGNQLPYVDRLQWGINQDSESLLLEAVGGKIDMQGRHLDSIANRPVLFANQAKGNYKLYKQLNAESNAMGLYLNQTHKDKAMREMLGNKNFRVAVSLGIDRPQIIEIIYLNQGEPWQIGPRRTHFLFNEKLSKQYTNYDPAESNKLLDGLGYTRRDAQGFRLRPDGKRVGFSVNVIPNLNPEHVDALELIKEQMRKIGIDLSINVVERSIFYERADNTDYDALTWNVSGGLEVYQNPREVVSTHVQGTWFALPWARWFVSNGRNGEEPSASMKKRIDLYQTFRKTVDAEKQKAIFKEILDEAADAFETIGIISDPDRYGVVNAALRNVPAEIPRAWAYPSPGPTLPQQYFFKR